MPRIVIPLASRLLIISSNPSRRRKPRGTTIGVHEPSSLLRPMRLVTAGL
ncbi:MAG: hypothetical protein ACK5NO_11810 [Demequina sp.]